jgi:hypothetical protein
MLAYPDLLVYALNPISNGLAFVNLFERVSIYVHKSRHDSTEINSTSSSSIGINIAPGSMTGLPVLSAIVLVRGI